MTRIETVAEPDASGTVAKIYDAARARAGRVSGVVKLMSLDPGTMRGSMQFYASLIAADALSGSQREMLATVVSNVNGCYY